MTKYRDDINDTYNDLKEAGVAMTLVITTTVEDDEGGVTKTEETFDSYGIELLKTSTTAGEGYIDGTLIKSTDKFVMVAAKTISTRPDASNELIINGKKYEIANVKALEPDGEPIYYNLHLRA